MAAQPCDGHPNRPQDQHARDEADARTAVDGHRDRERSDERVTANKGGAGSFVHAADMTGFRSRAVAAHPVRTARGRTRPSQTPRPCEDGGMADVVVWHNPRCSKSRSACTLLDERDLDVTLVRYLETPPSRAEIERVLALLGSHDPRLMMRTSEPLYRELGLAGADRGELLDAMAAHPILIERPIVIRGDAAVVARPPERLLDLIAADPEP